MNLFQKIFEKWKRFSILFYFDNWLQLVINRLFFRKLALTFYRKGNCEFLVDHAGGDQDGVVHCFIPGLYDPFFLASTENTGLRLLDLGANVGGFSLAAKARGFSFSRIVAVELNPFTASRLRFNLLHNFGQNVTVLNAGLSNKERGCFSLSFSRGSVADSLKSNNQKRLSKEGASFEIPSITFDNLILEHFDGGLVDICKMDVEGEEFDVLLGSHVSLLGSVRNLLIEVHTDADRAASLLDEKLTQYGFIRINTGVAFFEPNVFWWRNSRLEQAS